MRGVLLGGLWLGLIASTVGALQNQNQPAGITVQLPVLGVSIDADGLLTAQLFADVNGQVARDRLLAAQRRGQQALSAVSSARKISLRRLAEAIAAQGPEGPTEEMRHLAGLKRIEAVYLLPESGDILLAGPAANWMEDLSGRARAVDDGHPTLWLDDLLTALRTFAPQQPADTWVACSIDPTAEGTRQYQEFLRQIPRQVTAAQQAELARSAPAEMARRLGLADVRVWGIPPGSRMATVMIEADYRMKLMAVGLEPAPAVITTFAEAIEGAVSGTQRWWLTPKYDLLIQAGDGMGLRIEGQGVQLNTEDLTARRRGVEPQPAGKPLRAARRYAESFTRHYRELARQNPLFAELQSVVDLLVAAAWLQRVNGLGRVGWDGGVLLDPVALPAEPRTAAVHVPCVANAVWKDSLLAFPVGGGVSIAPGNALEPDTIRVDKQGAIDHQRQAIRIPADPVQWWWD